MKVLVTGSNGFVGSHIVEALLENGYEVVCQVRKTSNLRWLKGLNVKYFYGDVTDEKVLPEMVKGVDAIIHNAGLLRAIRKDDYYRVNQRATRNIAEAVLRHNPRLKKFVYISSQAAMGPCKALTPSDASGYEPPVSDYGLSKLAGENELKILKGKIPCTILRPASVYGPRDKDILLFFKLVNMGLRPSPLKERYTQLLFVKDLALAVVKSLQSRETDGKTYFLAEPKPYLWQDLGKTISEVMSRKTYLLPLPDFLFHLVAFFSEVVAYCFRTPATINRQKVREMRQCYWVGDATAAQKDMAMVFTNLKIGAKITYDWYLENGWL